MNAVTGIEDQIDVANRFITIYYDGRAEHLHGDGSLFTPISPV